MRILIADDEMPARVRLRRLVEELGGCEVVGEAPNGREALLLSRELEPDLLLLDIRMPGMDGLEVARHLSTLDHPPAVIFTTAYGDHALQAFEIHAVDYLLKPVRKERLAAALQAVPRLNRAQVGALGSDTGATRTHLCARVRGSLQLVAVADVRYFRAEQKYVTVRFPGGEVLVEESLKALEEELGASFLRVHRNALVAVAHIAGMSRDPASGYEVVLRDVPERLEVSRRHVAALRRTLRDLRN